jgi:hypothetical protein
MKTTSWIDPGQDCPRPFPDALPIVVSVEAIRHTLGHPATPVTGPACTASHEDGVGSFLRAPFLLLPAATGSQSSNGPRASAAVW